MSKNKPAKSATAKPTTDATPAADAAPAKKKRKPADPNKVKLPWAQRQLKPVGKLIRIATKLAARLHKHSAPGVHATMADDALACLTAIEASLNTPEAQGFKPAVRGKVTEGSIITVKSDAESRGAAVFTRLDPKTGAPYLNPDVFDGGTVLGDDRTMWFVGCVDGQNRLISKKLVQLAG